jgi:hypothetical protein
MIKETVYVNNKIPGCFSYSELRNMFYDDYFETIKYIENIKEE